MHFRGVPAHPSAVVLVRSLGRIALMGLALVASASALPAQNADDVYLDWPVGMCVDGRFAPAYGYTIEQDYAVRNTSVSGRCESTYNCYHAGLDIFRNEGGETSFNDPVFAVADGRVVAILNWGGDTSQGMGVLLEHPTPLGAFYSQYVHLRSGDFLYVQEGQAVRRGQLLGRMMDYPSEDHLHFEVRPGLRVRYCDGSPNCTSFEQSCRGNGYSLLNAQVAGGDLAAWGFADPVDAHFGARPPFPTAIAVDAERNVRSAPNTTAAVVGTLSAGTWVRGRGRPRLVRTGGAVTEAWYPVTIPEGNGFCRDYFDDPNAGASELFVSELARIGRQWQPPSTNPVVDARFGFDCSSGTGACCITDAAVTNRASGGGAGFAYGELCQPPPYDGLEDPANPNEPPVRYCDLAGRFTGLNSVRFDLPTGTNFRNGVAIELSLRLDDLATAGRQVLAAQGPAGAEVWTLSVEGGLPQQRLLRFEVRLADGSTRQVDFTLPEPVCTSSLTSLCDNAFDNLTVTAPNCSGVPAACNPDEVEPGCVSEPGYRQWHHIAARADRATGALELYWDGQRVSPVGFLPLSLTSAAGPIRIGAGLRGLLDNVTVWATSGVVELDPEPIVTPAPVVDEGTSVTFSTAVRNRGNADSGPFRVRWWLDGAVVATSDHPSLGPNQVLTAPGDLLTWTATEPPTRHTIFFVADIDHQVVEVNERNNDASAVIDVIPAPDPCGVTTGVCEPVPSLLTHPDLRPVSLFLDQGELLEGSRLTFGAVVENRGYVSAPSFSALWQVDGMTETPLLPHTALAPRSSTRDPGIDFSWRAQPGRHRILVWLDPPTGVVAEANENNNRRALTVDVVAAPDLHPTPIVFDSAAARAGEPVFLDAGVENLGSVASGGFNVRWWIDGEVVAAGFHGGVPARGQVLNGNSQLTWTFGPGSHEVIFEVDYSAFVVEGDEENNTATATIGGGLDIVRVDTDPVAIVGQKELDKLFDGLTWWPNTAIIHFVPNTPVGVQMELAGPRTLEAFRVSMAGVDFGGNGAGTYRFKVETANAWNGPFTTVVSSYEVDCRIEVATIRLPAPTTARVFKVTATRANGDGVVHWLELQPIPSLAEAGFPLGLARVDTDPVVILGQKDLGKLLDGVIAWPNTAITHFVANADVTAVLEFAAPTFVSGFWVSVAGTDFGGSQDGTYLWRVEAGDSPSGPFTTIVNGYATDSRDGLVEVPLLASVQAKVYRVTANRTNGDGVVHWLELGPMLIRP